MNTVSKKDAEISVLEVIALLGDDAPVSVDHVSLLNDLNWNTSCPYMGAPVKWSIGVVVGGRALIRTEPITELWEAGMEVVGLNGRSITHNDTEIKTIQEQWAWLVELLKERLGVDDVRPDLNTTTCTVCGKALITRERYGQTAKYLRGMPNCGDRCWDAIRSTMANCTRCGRLEFMDDLRRPNEVDELCDICAGDMGVA